MMRIWLPRAKPVAHAARPAYELSSEMTTGMSAPPIGSTAMTPSASPVPAMPKKTCGELAIEDEDDDADERPEEERRC